MRDNALGKLMGLKEDKSPRQTLNPNVWKEVAAETVESLFKGFQNRVQSG